MFVATTTKLMRINEIINYSTTKLLHTNNDWKLKKKMLKFLQDGLLLSKTLKGHITVY